MYCVNVNHFHVLFIFCCKYTAFDTNVINAHKFMQIAMTNDDKIDAICSLFRMNRFESVRWWPKFSSNIRKLCSWDVRIGIVSSMIAFMRGKRYEKISKQKLQKKHKHSSQTQEHLNIFQIWIAHEIVRTELQYQLSFQVIWNVPSYFAGFICIKC